MATSHGSKAVFKLDNAGGSLTDISQYIDSVTFSPAADVVEDTTMGDASKSYLSGLKDATISIEGPWDPAVDVILEAALGASATKSFEYHPQGTATGTIKYSGECICTSYEIDTSVDEVGRFSAELQVTAGWTRGTNP